MDKAINAMKKNKVVIFGFWIALLYLIILSLYFVLNKSISIIEIIFIFAIGCFIYVDVALSKEYIKAKKVMNAVKSIESRYEYIQTYIEENAMIIEIQKKEVDRLKNDIKGLKIIMEELKEDKDLIQFFIKI